MSLRFIIGRAGTGKTRLCMEEIRQRRQKEPDRPLIYLVPEQSTFFAEKNFLEFAGLDGTIQVQVLSFQRLAWHILQETGGGINPVLNEVGKALILRSLLEQNKSRIKAFARVLDSPGFLEDLIRGLAEFKVYNISPQQLENCQKRLAEAGKTEFSAKLHDLACIYGEFVRYLENKYLDTEDFLTKLARKIPSSAFLEQAEIWLDGFSGFTPQEYLVIGELLAKIPRVHVTLCMEGSLKDRHLEETDLFYPPWDTYQKLVKISREMGCPIEEVQVLDYGEKHRFSKQADLAFLEESFFMDKPVYDREVSGLKLVGAANHRVELEVVAREILNLCREKNYRFLDIAVLFRDFTPYESLLPTVFADYGIPYFLDQKRRLKHHPLVDLLQAALDVLEHGWNYEPVFRYLKTDLACVSRQEVDLLENYCLAHGIRGSRWTDNKPWRYRRRFTLREEENDLAYSAREEAELTRINKARQKACRELHRLEIRMKEARTAKEKCACLYEFLADLGAAHKLQHWSHKAEEEGRLEEAQVHKQVWQKIMGLLEQMAEVLGEQETALLEFNRIIKSGLDSIELALIPPGLDQVLVGTLNRSRNPNMRAVFLLGLNDGVVPLRAAEEGLLSDEERNILAGLDITLAPTSEKRLYAEQYLVYSAFTRASDFLQVSCALADEEGRALSPSFLFTQIARMFPTPEGETRVQYLNSDPEPAKDAAYLVHPLPSLAYLAAGLRQAVDGKNTSPLWWDVYSWYLENHSWQESLRLVIEGLFYANREEVLTPAVINKLYGNILLTSVSRLEKYRACPFAYFLNYGLRLQEREEYKLKAPDLGQFFHAALENVYLYLQEQGSALSELDEEQLAQVVEAVVDDLVPQLQNELLLSTSRYRYLTKKLKRIVLRAVRVLREHEKRGTFRPLGLEVSFGREGQLPGLKISLKNGKTIILQGRIDLVDSAPAERGYYLRVIDFKSGRPTISLMEIYYGLKLQLLTYLDVVMTHAPDYLQVEAAPGGVLYFKIQDPLLSGEGPLEQEDIDKKILRELKMNGYVLKDPQAVRLMDSQINGYSDLIPAAMKKDGEFYQNCEQLLTLEEFGRLRRHVENVLAEIGEEICAGNIAIHPYRYRGKTPCGFCPYRSVCRFEPSVSGQEYRQLPVREPHEIWYEIGVRREEKGNAKLDERTGNSDQREK